MTMIEAVTAMAPGLLVGAVVGAAMRAAGHKPGVNRALHVIICGALMWAALEHLGEHVWSGRLLGALFGWVIGSGGWAFLGNGGWWRRGGGGDDGPAGPWGPDPEDHRPEVEPVVAEVAPSTRPVERADADLALWDEFERTPAFEPERHEVTPATAHAERVARLRGRGRRVR